jgi:hypothetical protein
MVVTYMPLAEISSSIPVVSEHVGECALAWWHGIVMAGYALVGIQAG